MSRQARQSGGPNELMPRTASRCRRYRLVEWLEALHTSVPDAVELIEVSTVDGIFRSLKEAIQCRKFSWLSLSETQSG